MKFFNFEFQPIWNFKFFMDSYTSGNEKLNARKICLWNKSNLSIQAKLRDINKTKGLQIHHFKT